MYTVESRAIPSVVDGFKPTQRKVAHIANKTWKSGSEKPMKVFQLTGKIAAEAFYHHGNTSLDSAIINMAQRFKNNMPILEEIGQFGSLRAPDSGAARYISTKLTENFRLLYKDFELLKPKFEEGQEIEPEYFLPIVPAVLLNGGSGIAVGFASNILNRDTKELIDESLRALEGKKVRDVKPFMNGFDGEYSQDKENPKKWYIRGKYEVLNTTTVKITELPPFLTYEKYEELLDDLVVNKKIVSYEDNSSEKVDYIIKFTRENLAEYIQSEKLVKMFRLEQSETENFTVLDEFGKLKIFESSADIISYFVKFRLTYYTKRKEFLVAKIGKECSILEAKARFIAAVVKNELKVNNVPKATIVNWLEKNKYFKVEDSFDYLLRMPIYSLTKEMCQKLMEDLKNKRLELDVIKKTQPQDMYRQDLLELRKNINKTK
jgi:DNA topoisomerase II